MFTSTWLNLSVVVLIQQFRNMSTEELPEDATLNSIGLATKYGHPPTRYDVVTEDGYILTLYRLPGRIRIPVLLTHGFLDSSDSWLLRGKTSLAITLANNGLDVWLANSRGNRYSRQHQRLNPDTDPEYWNFSFHEMGFYDLPAIIDTILSETGAKNITAIGHSQGNTMFYVLGSERKEYNSKINVLIALAPLAYLNHIKPPVSHFIQAYPIVNHLMKKAERFELFGDNSTTGLFIHKLCSAPNIVYSVCVEGILFPATGEDLAELEPEFALTYAAHFPAGTSIKCLLHLMQVGYTKTFARFDRGSELDRRISKSSYPSEYPLDKITMPIALLVAKNDRLSTIPDVAILRSRLPNVVYYLENPRSIMNHVDFTVGRNMPAYLFPYVFRILNDFHAISLT